MRINDFLRARLVTGYDPLPIAQPPLEVPADDPWDPALVPAAPAPSSADGGLRMRDLQVTSDETGGGVEVELGFPAAAGGTPAWWTAEGAQARILAWRWRDAAGMEIEFGGRLSESGRANYFAFVGHSGLAAAWRYPFAAAARSGGLETWPWGAPGAPDEHLVHRLHTADAAGWRVAIVDTGGPAARADGGFWTPRPGRDGSGDPVPIWAAGGPFPARKFQIAAIAVPRSARPRPFHAPPPFPAGVELGFGPLGGAAGRRQDLDEQATRDWALTAVPAPGPGIDTGFGPDPFIDRHARILFLARARALAVPRDSAEHWLDLIASDMLRMRGAGDDADGAVVLPARPDLGLPAQVVDVHFCEIETEPFFLRLDAGGREVWQLGVRLHYSLRPPATPLAAEADQGGESAGSRAG